MKNHYIAISVKQDGKNCASILKVSGNENLLFSLQIPGITAANICGTKKEAESIVQFWNECYKKNKTYGGL